MMKSKVDLRMNSVHAKKVSSNENTESVHNLAKPRLWTYRDLFRFGIVNSYCGDGLKSLANALSVGDTFKLSNDIETDKGQMGEIIHKYDSGWFAVKFQSGIKQYNTYQLFARIMPRKYLDITISPFVYTASVLTLLSYVFFLFEWYFPLAITFGLVGIDLWCVIAYLCNDDTALRRGKYEWDIDFHGRLI